MEKESLKDWLCIKILKRLMLQSEIFQGAVI
jgi:hypothetical protein